jgi:glycine hydroxymethyltransferase
MAAFFALGLQHGDTMMALSLPHGGHLTHGSKVNFSGKWFDIAPYEVEAGTELIDMDRVAAIARERRPKVLVAGATAYPRALDFAAFKVIADEVGARLMVDAAHFAGLVAGGAHPSPVPHADVVTFTTHKTLRGPRGGTIVCTAEHASAVDKAVFPMMQGGPLEHVIAAKAVAFGEALQPDFAGYAAAVVSNARALAAALAAEGLRIVSGGTDIHYLLADLRDLDAELTGAEAEACCGRAGISLNRNAIPFDPRPPLQASGLRIGTAAVTTQGMGTAEMEIIAGCIARVLRDPEEVAAVRDRVDELCAAFPAYGAS